MSKISALIGSALFFVIAPGTVVGLLPWSISHWQTQPAFFGQEWLRVAGGVLVLVGLLPLLNSFLRFALEGLGTPAPVAPPQNLVVTGFYRRVRNPIYVALIVILIGEVLIFGNTRLLAYAAIAWLFFHLVVLIYEEPTLRLTFGDEYRTYCQNVPRWLPRIIPWTAPTR